ncbi:MAG: DUF3078 domain-containing protein [Crocinitomicaceae bacterium]|nr:DUF3078 domain-containing protein [Crocinitomicaceae bacterium]
MKTSLLLASMALFIGVSFGQTDSVQPDWKFKSIYGLNGTQSSFVNWNAGGRNNISVLGFISASAKYKKSNIKWDNNLDLALGGLQYVDNKDEQIQKTDDRIDLATNFGYLLKKNYYLSIIGGFRTQFMDGFSYPDLESRISKFMAPGYVNIALGIDYSPKKNLSVFVSPMSSKMTFVQDQTLANAGAFGVQGAGLNDAGVWEAGRQYRGEFGAYFKMMYSTELAKNIFMKSKLELFSNYMNNPENIDVAAEVLFTFKVNKWFSATLNWNLLYDDDIKFSIDNDNNGTIDAIGPRTQFKSVLGVGVSYTMQNYVNPPKK